MTDWPLLWKSSLERLLGRLPAVTEGDAAIFWGKGAALAFRRRLEKRPDPGLVLVLSPELAPFRLPSSVRWVRGEHPIPGKGSLAAAAELLEFFDALGRTGTRTLDVHLSGGASSLAWLPPAGLALDALREKLEGLYRLPLTISELNFRRAHLCALKAGGAARWLRRLAPRVRVRVQVLSDVCPFGPSVVGSGPFWDGRVRHRVWGDNRIWVREFAAEAESRGIPVLSKRSCGLETVESWARRQAREARQALRRGSSGLILAGGEPRIGVPQGTLGQGGRMTHLGLLLFRALEAHVLEGRLEIFCASSDGSDGNSGSAGVVITRATVRRLRASAVERALESFESARALRPGLLSRESTGVNVQDLVVVRVL